MSIGLTMMMISQCIHITNYHIVHLKYMQSCFSKAGVGSGEGSKIQDSGHRVFGLPVG